MNYWSGKRAVIGTMHGKESVIGPRLASLGLSWQIPVDFDTDQFGTFSGEQRRAGTPHDAARAKARASMALTGCPIGVASEGSFGPHPTIPFLQIGHEIVILIDSENDVEIIGQSTTSSPGVSSATVRSVTEAVATALTWGFPEQGVIIRGSEHSGPYEKNCTTVELLEAAITQMLTDSVHKTVCLQTDLRAHRHRTRLTNIASATDDLITRCQSYCPRCGTPGFGCGRTVRGLPCIGCGQPTDLVATEHWRCVLCPYEEPRPRRDGRPHADPGDCSFCNP